jgi:hypothetical protein
VDLEPDDLARATQRALVIGGLHAEAIGVAAERL